MGTGEALLGSDVAGSGSLPAHNREIPGSGGAAERESEGAVVVTTVETT